MPKFPKFENKRKPTSDKKSEDQAKQRHCPKNTGKLLEEKIENWAIGEHGQRMEDD